MHVGQRWLCVCVLSFNQLMSPFELPYLPDTVSESYLKSVLFSLCILADFCPKKKMSVIKSRSLYTYGTTDAAFKI